MTDIAIVPARRSHIDAVAADMRAADTAEVWASSLATPRQALETSLSCSTTAFAGLVDGAPACLFGSGPVNLLTRTGGVWLLGTAAIDRHAMAFARRNRAMLPELFGDLWDTLTNRVDARNRVTRRWLRWLGARFEPAEPFGPFGLPFQRFELQRFDLQGASENV